ncbi:MAG: hypothetical protein KFF68_02405, partial [Desulfosarcina sp.]|nr:hypothetical protein [Desulfosarcina sp.]
MTAQQVEDTPWTKLRRRVELLVGPPHTAIDQQEGDEIRRLIHEIRANHIELEMQNEELSKSRDTVGAARQKYEKLYRNYAGLFNFAPIGYMV